MQRVIAAKTPSGCDIGPSRWYGRRAMAKDDDKAAEEELAGEDSAAEDGEEAGDDGEEAEAPAPKKTPAKKGVEPRPTPKPHSTQEVEPPSPEAGLGKSVFVFFAVMVLLAGGFWFLGSFDNPFGGGAPKWRVGQSYPVDLTLDPADDTKLSCASETELAGKRCEYESKSKRHEKKLEDGNMLRPYSLADGSARLLAAGVWSAPELEKSVRPKDRFTLKCQFKVEGKINSPAVRWDIAGAWNEKNEDWFAGTVSDCKLAK